MNQDRKFSDFEGLVEMKDLASTKTLIKSNPKKAPNLPANADLEDNYTPLLEDESPSPTSKVRRLLIFWGLFCGSFSP